MIIEVKYIGIIFMLSLMDLVVFQFLYGGFDACPINTEFQGVGRAILRVGVFRSQVFHCKILNMP